MRAVIGLIFAALLAVTSTGCGNGANPGVIDPGIAPPPPQKMDPKAQGGSPPPTGGSVGSPMDYTQ